MSSNPQHVENLHKLKALGFDVEEQLEDTFESWGYDEQVYLMTGIMPKISKLTQQVADLRAALEAIKLIQEVMDGGDEMILSKLTAYAIANKALEQAQ